MWRIKLSSSDKKLLFPYRMVLRELTPKGKWSYYTELGWYPTKEQAMQLAKTYIGHGLRVAVVWVEMVKA